MKTTFLFLIGLLVSIGAVAAVSPEKDEQTEKKIEELISKMTLDEKLGQMAQFDPGQFGSDEKTKQAIKDGKVGSILNLVGAKRINELQRVAVEESRLGIPIIIGRDVIHGYRTITPIPLGMAASWNAELTTRTMTVAAEEAAAEGIHWTFAPMIDVSRDPRWGRIAESCGEDTYLSSVMAKAMVQGFQGDDLSDPKTIAACAKHYVGYGAAEGGRDYNTTYIPVNQLRNDYLPPFKAATDAGVATFMSGFNDLNGVPVSGNEFTLKTILREEWGFDGMVVSDWASIAEMIAHGYAKDTKEAGYKALRAGVDMEMVSRCYLDNVQELLDEGKIEMATIDKYVGNILRVKFRLGLFDHPYTDETLAEKTILSEEHKEIAKEAASESFVLLQNKNEILPLSNEISSVAVIGPLADAPHDQMGTWVFDGKKENTVTPYAALTKMLGASKVNFAKGLETSRTKSTEGFAAAVDAAEKSDVVLLFLGEESILSGEAHSLADLNLRGAQSQLLNAMKETGKPVVLVIMAGRQLTIEDALGKADAILYAWAPGTMGGPALAEMIFGETVPSGKLPVTFPKTVGQIPIYYNHKNTGRPANYDNWTHIDKIPVEAGQTSLGNTSHYLDAGFEPLFPFGYGLSYTTFDYSDLELSSKTMEVDGSIIVSVSLKNTGKYEGSEVVQLYVRDRFGSLTRPVKQLKGYKKVSLKPDETKQVTLTLSAKDLEFFNGIDYVIEPGDFDIWVGTSSKEGLHDEFSIN
ncbi:glycoside hydrolase family 3 N-terminal domain-containing protein [uncultured Sunxiuqinia sp.]|uniref:glycoside hydrolase family 3 N-terminal domain-containing protein n=1 Tax=uncultured Sunxiuqinia sp. TaxID=1573825 RepID=UPI002AA86B5F|nr:glycoside hydrolase family 3 N-terminal domain-containing protein [uncultured Sunxiuqinia sp.]